MIVKATYKTLFSYTSRYAFSEGTKAEKQKVILFPGNGIGPEISQSVVDIFAALKIPIEWEAHQIFTKGQTADGDLISQASIDAV